MRIVVTGAAGFVGRSLVRYLRDSGFPGQVCLVDRKFAGDEPFETLALELTEEGAVARAVEGADCVIHLAALPGAASAAGPLASRCVNFEVAHELIGRLKGRRLIYASSIAVLGSDFSGPADDATPPDPDSVYGMHKRMAELAFADAVNAGSLSGLALRLPGIVARPRSAEGFGSAFLSEVFHAAWEGASYTLPVAEDATSWLMSAETCARNLALAALTPASDAAAMNLPALRVRMGELVEALGECGDNSAIRFAEVAAVRKAFASYPPLRAARAEHLGFASDNGLAGLVSRARPATRLDATPHQNRMERRA